MTTRALTLLASTAFFLLSTTTTTSAATPPPAIKLWRLDCGLIQEDDLNLFSDTYAYVGKSKQLTAGCYLIKHGDTYMLWDTGLSTEAIGKPL